MFTLFVAKLKSLQDIVLANQKAPVNKKVPKEIRSVMPNIRFSTYDGVISAYFGTSKTGADYLIEKANKVMKNHRAYLCTSNGKFAVLFSPKTK